MVNPHWDEEINVKYPFGDEYTGQQAWSPQQEWGDVGGGGEFTGSRREEVLPSPNMPGSYRGGPEGWGNYPVDEFAGIETISRGRNKPQFTGLGRLGRPELSFRYSHIDPSKKGIGTGGSGEMSNRPDYFRDDESIRGTWRMMEDARRFEDLDEYGYLEGAPRQRTTFTEGYIDPRSFDEIYGGVYDDAIFRTVDPNTGRMEYADNDMMDDDLMNEIELAKIYQSGDPGMINEGSNWNFMPGGDPLWDEVSPQGEAINQILQDPSLQKIIQGLIKSGETDPNVFRQYIRPDILEQLPPGAFTTIDDFINQQPITVI